LNSACAGRTVKGGDGQPTRSELIVLNTNVIQFLASICQFPDPTLNF
jgi:hypothetical protein